MIISFVNQKGGVGKSTLSFHFACWLAARGREVGFFDADTQRSSSRWMAAHSRDIPLDAVDLTRPNDLPRQVLELAEGLEFVICDGPGGLGEVTRTLLVLSDLAVFPIAASFLDAESLAEARSQLEYATSIHPATPPLATVVLNKVRRRARLARDAREALRSLGIDALSHSVRDLDVFKLAPQSRTTVWELGRAGQHGAADLDAVFTELMALVEHPRREVAHG
ncbi:MAG: ParA family protein [Planctomycetes bacterium]|nr:ParA family protein [Planctomycetota bacterium]